MRISDWSSDVCSSDLRLLKGEARHGWRSEDDELRRPRPWPLPHRLDVGSEHLLGGGDHRRQCRRDGRGHRSEEHTSELQSLMRISYAVFCLKKNNSKMKTTHYYTLRTPSYDFNTHCYIS